MVRGAANARAGRAVVLSAATAPGATAPAQAHAGRQQALHPAAGQQRLAGFVQRRPGRHARQPERLAQIEQGGQAAVIGTKELFQDQADKQLRRGIEFRRVALRGGTCSETRYLCGCAALAIAFYPASASPIRRRLFPETTDRVNRRAGVRHV